VGRLITGSGIIFNKAPWPFSHVCRDGRCIYIHLYVYMITLCTLDKITVTHECGFSMIVQLIYSLNLTVL